MKYNLFLALILIFSAFTCEKEENSPVQDCSVKFSETTNCSFEGLSIKFQSVEDSRCPVNANCVWEGEVIIGLLVGNEAATVGLSSNKPGIQSDAVGDYIIKLVAVTPFPVLDSTFMDEDYVAELEVRRR